MALPNHVEARRPRAGPTRNRSHGRAPAGDGRAPPARRPRLATLNVQHLVVTLLDAIVSDELYVALLD